MSIPRSLFEPTEPSDHDLTLQSGSWPEGVSGEMLISAPHPSTLGGPHPFFGDGMVHRLSLEPGRHGAAEGTFAWRSRRIESPSARLRLAAPELFEATMVGVHSPFGHTNAANTAPLPWGDRLFATWDAGRPVELDPQTLGYLGEVGHRDQWKVFEVSPQPVLPMILSTAHPVIDPDRDVMWTVNLHWGELHVVRYDGDGGIESWPVDGGVIPQSVHTITQTRDWLIVGDCAYKVEPQVLSGGERTEPTNADGPLYFLRKDELDRTPPGRPVGCKVVRIAPEINHYYADLDDSDGVAIVFEHTENADIAMTQRAGDLDALGRPCDPALAGLYGFPMSPDRVSRVVFDPTTERILHRCELRDPSMLWGRQLNALDWSTEGRLRPTLHHTVHHGWRPEAITQRMLALYRDRVDRSEWPDSPTPPMVVSTSLADMAVVGHHEFAMDDFPSSPVFVPRDPGSEPGRSRHAGSDPGGHDGWLVVPVMNDAGLRVELFDAARVGDGPVATLGAGPTTVPFVLHAAWTPVQAGAPAVERVRFSDELERVDELPVQLAALVRAVADDLDQGAPMVAAPR